MNKKQHESDIEAAARRAAEGIVEEEFRDDTTITRRWQSPDRVAKHLFSGTDG
jgi:hypothetical protein